MDKTLTYRQAWRNFHDYITAPERWAALSQADRNRVSMAESDYHERRIEKRTGRPYGLGNDRIERILTSLAPGRYEFRQIVILHDGQ